MRRHNKRNRSKYYLGYNMQKEAFEDIFGNGFINIKKISEFKSDVENFRRIDQAVRYAKTKDNEFRIKYLNMVEATRVYYEKDLEGNVSSASIFSYMAILISIATLSDTLTANGKNFKVEGGFFKSEDKIYDITGTIIEPGNLDQCFLKISSFILILLILLVAAAFFLSLWRVSKNKQILKNLTYLEKQLESYK